MSSAAWIEDAKRLRDGIIPCYSALVWQCPVLGSSALEGHGHTDTEKSQEGDGLKCFPYEERLKEFGLYRLEKRGNCRILFTEWKYLKGGQRWDRIRLFSVVTSDKVWVSGYKLKHRRFFMNIRRRLVIVWMTEYWHSFPRQVCEVSILEEWLDC